MRLIRILTQALLTSDGSGLRLVLREWQRYQLLPRAARGRFRAAAGIVAHWRREFALVLLIVVCDHPRVTAGVLVMNVLAITFLLLSMLPDWAWL